MEVEFANVLVSLPSSHTHTTTSSLRRCFHGSKTRANDHGNDANGAVAVEPPPPPAREGGKQILKSVSGKVASRRFTLMIGHSGSGKTTLLTTLAHRFERALRYEGTIRYSGERWSRAMKRKVAFVPQDDVVIPGLTVREFLYFAAKLRLPHETPETTREERIATLISKLRLEKCQNGYLGSITKRGISGGERKRACIACELVTSPTLLLTDEVTSGLDSSLSLVVVEILKDLVRSQELTVLATLHSPTSTMFSLFDDVIIMNDGEIFYRGPTTSLVKFVEGRLGRTVPPHHNPCDFVLDFLFKKEVPLEGEPSRDVEAPPPSAGNGVLVVEGHSFVESNGNGTHNGDDDPAHEKNGGGETARKRLVPQATVMFAPEFGEGGAARSDDNDKAAVGSRIPSNERAIPFAYQVYYLFRRMWKKCGKELITWNSANVGLTAIASVLWFNLSYDEDQIFGRLALAFWLAGSDTYLSLFGTVFAFQEDEAVLRKDLHDGSYSLFSYFIAKSLALYPMTAFWSLLYNSLVLAFTQLAPTPADAVLVVLSCLLVQFTFQSVGLLISAAIPAPSIVTTAIVVVTYLFAYPGFFAPNAPPGVQWLTTICLARYSWFLLMNIIFVPADVETVTFKCADASTTTWCKDTNQTVITGRQVVDKYHVDVTAGECAAVLIVSGLVFRALAYGVMVRKHTMKNAI